jgi:hypothetical protein
MNTSQQLSNLYPYGSDGKSKCLFHRSSAISIILLIVISFSACKNEVQKQRDELIQQARAIINGNDSSSVRMIELTIQQVESFIRKNPEQKDHQKLTRQLEELYQALDEHQLKEYRTRFGKLATTPSPDIAKVIVDLEDFAAEFAAGRGAEMAGRQETVGELLVDCKKLLEEFRSMQQFFSQDFPPTLEAYNYLIQYNSPSFDNSEFDSVRRSWKLVADTYRSKIVERELLEKSRNFGHYLKMDAETIANKLYKGYVLDRSRPTETLRMGRITDHASYDGRECEATFRVYLKRNFLGWNKGWTQLTVKGVLMVTLNGNNERAGVEYKHEEYRVEGSEL